MELLLPVAAKSLLIGGAALLLLHLASKRSAAERSWIAHLGLAALLMLPIGALTLPAINIVAPEFVTLPADETAAAPVARPEAAFEKQTAQAPPPAGANFPHVAARADAVAAREWALWFYAAPAFLLLLFTVIAVGRLLALRGRAEVLIEPHWLTALARAQQRMGFKHGTALLTSDELPSPISWGVMRPVILLNSEAAKSHGEAEAIITHELAHVARLDWAKLMISRIAVA
ncbi:MAG TPA: M56 family metallopeptidase, partial [Chloroflexota bacterium]|nr:M56 family metallopeptidase [Chloroflexota bacterium]